MNIYRDLSIVLVFCFTAMEISAFEHSMTCIGLFGYSGEYVVIVLRAPDISLTSYNPKDQHF